MSLEELKKFKEDMESEQKWVPIVRVSYKSDKKDDSYLIGRKGEKEEFIEKDDTELFISSIEDNFKSQVERMIGTPYDYTLDLSFDFGLVCKEIFANNYLVFEREKNHQIDIYRDSLLEHSIPKKVAIKLGDLVTKCYYDRKEVANVEKRVIYPSYNIFVVDFDNLVSRLSELGYALRISNPSTNTNSTFSKFDTIASAFKVSCATPEKIHIFIDFSDKMGANNSPKKYTNRPSKKKNTKKESE